MTSLLNIGVLSDLELSDLVDRLRDAQQCCLQVQPQEMRAVIELLTLRITECARDGRSELLEIALGAYERALGWAADLVAIGQVEVVVRRQNLSAALLRLVPTNDSVPLLSQTHIVNNFLDSVSISPGEALELARNWKRLDNHDVMYLRNLKNMLIPTLAALDNMGASNINEHLLRWKEVVAKLP